MVLFKIVELVGDGLDGNVDVVLMTLKRMMHDEGDDLNTTSSTSVMSVRSYCFSSVSPK